MYRDFFEPPTIDEFVDVKRRAAVRTLLGEIESKIDGISLEVFFFYLPLFHEPSTDAAITAQFTAEWAQMSFLQLFHANKASKDIDEGLKAASKKYLS